MDEDANLPETGVEVHREIRRPSHFTPALSALPGT